MKNVTKILNVIILANSLIFIPVNSCFAEMITQKNTNRIQNPKQNHQSIRLLLKANSNEFNEILTFASEALKIYINKVSNQEVKSSKLKILSQFIDICGDNDYADDVMITKNTDNKNHLVFTCFNGYEVKSGLSFIFDIDEWRQEVTAFSLIEIFQNENSKKDSSGTTHLAQTVQSDIQLILKESSVLVLSAATSAVAAKTVFTGQQDKLKHAVLSSLISSIVTSAAHHFLKLSPKKSAIVGFSVCSAIGLGKEVWDKFNPGHSSDVQDFAADLIGCGSGSLGMSLLIEY